MRIIRGFSSKEIVLCHGRKITNQKIKGSVERMDFSAHFPGKRPNFDELCFWVRIAENTYKYSFWLKYRVPVRITEILRNVKVKGSLFLCLIKYVPIRLHGRVQVQHHAFLISEVKGGERSGLSSGHFGSGERDPGKH
jgi:hypothetical protein